MDASGTVAPADDELTHLMKETIRKTKEDGYTLNMNGIFNAAAIAYNDRIDKKRGVKPTDPPPFDFQNPRLRMLFSIVPLILQKSERKHTYSYSGKHTVEKLFRHGYVSNGEFILVCIALGYKIKYDPNTPNCNIFGIFVDTIPTCWIGGTPPYGTYKFPC
jgi:hypothetical protein